MRKHIFKNKQGISPLIATVLLIAFAVALGAVVMNWGKNYVTQTAMSAQQSGQAKQKCTNTNMKFVVVSGVPQVCYEGNLTNPTEIKFTIKNQAAHEVLDVEVSVLGEDDLIEQSIVDYATKYENKFPLDANKMIVAKLNTTDVGELKKVTFTPYIRVDGEKDPQPCTDNTLDVDADEIYQCS